MTTLAPGACVTKRSATDIDLNSVLANEAYTTNLKAFLALRNRRKALHYAIENFVSPAHYSNVQQTRHAILKFISDIDELINLTVNSIIHHRDFQQLEASWRGLWMLVLQGQGHRNIKVKMLDIKWAEVVKDISKAMEFDQSQLFDKIYSEEYGSPGGEPYGAIIGDYQVSHQISKSSPYDDISTLAGIAQIAAASFSPFITSASSELFGLDSFADFGSPINFDSIFDSPAYQKWNQLRKTPDTRFVGITLPKTLMRQPYRTSPGSYKGLYFYEINGANNDSRLWGNACYAFANVLLREFANVGWFGHIRGVPRDYNTGGLVKEYPIESFTTDADGIAFKSITDVVVTDISEKSLSQLGFIPLCQGYLSPHAMFYNNQSLHHPKSSGVLTRDTNEKLSAMLQHVLCGCRISHYIKLMVRDKIGSFATAQSCENQIRRWLRDYTTGSESLDWDEQAKYPLKEGSVRVKEHPSKPGVFLCAIELQPHYQLDQMVSELELVTELASFRRM